VASRIDPSAVGTTIKKLKQHHEQRLVYAGRQTALSDLFRIEVCHEDRFFGKQNAFCMEMLRRLQLDNSRDTFLHGSRAKRLHRWNGSDYAFDRVVSTEIEAR